MDFQNSKTYSNLMAAYNDELNSSAKYLIYSDTAQQEGYIEISNIYIESSNYNRQHARTWLRQMSQGSLPSTSETLLESSRFEKELSTEKYQEYARIALEEGYKDIASLFNGVANIAYNQSSRFSRLFEEVERGDVFCRQIQMLWICMKCGNIMSGECAPLICPVCGFPQGYYRLLNEDYDY